MHRIVIVGGGYAGFYAAWRLEKTLRPGEAEVTLVDPRPYMTYQPFLPEVLAGSIEPRHSVVSFRRHLRSTRLLTARVTRVDHAQRRLDVELPDGTASSLGYDTVVVTAGAVTRTFPVPGVAERAVGLKTIEEAVFIRDTLLRNVDTAAGLPPGPERERLLTVVFVGGGYAGIEAFGELRSLATALLRRYPELSPAETHFHLVEASGRILPEVSERTSRWVLRHLAGRGAHVHLHTQLVSVDGDRLLLSDGRTLDTGLLVWTAGVVADPRVTRHTDLPTDARGRIRTRADLRVGTATSVVPGAWAAGDDAAVPDLTGGGIDGTTVPNAQHAVRQGKLLAENLVRTLRGRSPRSYRHRDLGAVATLGLGHGVFQSGPLVVRGFPAWLVHRGYHVLAVPTWERKWRVAAGWATALLLGRDTVGLSDVRTPRAAFTSAAAAQARAISRPAPLAAAPRAERTVPAA
ncbi:NAD(P)/FAD-dependent oxidoreductase [Modestobacter sp. I12A-02628]|uniref:FAD-dependent oxidoreductase n=1 Tax=Goekera deserti TaxID=2497753 RepID=A0A7K3WBI2_9ACTN|nr:FAD-dependent oxidoreductase [Goekera deserti]MPQ98246.1 NAD(P)/FAD-dependent oxidoreductase [Goekera deserti]NDI48072.1 FAD-dependent oxidoreductase [Goekera deserti]NEL53821.1 FAD-dependent oxidoreductase [Goekera deserti]